MSVRQRVSQRVYFDPHETHRLRELEGVKLASFKRRAAAMAIDLGFLVVLVIVISFAIAAVKHLSLADADRQSIPVSIRINEILKNPFVQFAILLGYFGLATFISNGKTLGKWAMRIRVLSTVHGHMSLWHSLERGLGYLASSLEFGFGFMQYFINPNHRCVHDRIAETIVVEEEAIRRLKRVDQKQ